MEETHSLLHIRKPRKIHKLVHLNPTLIGELNTRIGKAKHRNIRILCDSGSSSSIILGRWTDKLRMKNEKIIDWKTKAGIFKTNKTCKVQFVLPEFDLNKVIEWKMHVDDSTEATSTNYDMIMGTDLMEELDIIMDFKLRVMTWDGASVPMKDRNIVYDIEMLHCIQEETYESEII